MKLQTLVLAAALLGIGGAPLAAQEPATEAARVRAEMEAARAQVRMEAEKAREEAAREMAVMREEADREGVSVLTGDQTVAEGEVIDGDMVVIGGSLRVRGEIRGNAVVTGGDLRLERGGTVHGDAVVTGGRLVNQGGRVLGEMRTVAGPGRHAPRPPRGPVAVVHGPSGWFDEIGEAIAGVFSTLAFGLVLAGVAAGLVFYGLPRLRLVSETVRGYTGRSAAVGLAATFLIVPAFILLIVALAVSIIGIPLILVAVPLYPLAVVAALGFGLVAVAHVIGERTAEQRSDLDFRWRNAYAYAFLGVGLMLAPMLAGHLIGMVGFLDWVGGLLMFVSVAGMIVSAMVGMGAVILTRGGTRPVYTPPAYDPAFDHDPLFDAEPAAREPHV
ncbi:MAG TPA: hypothetical protein VF263_23100 [Longimicrobiaceae bacterium]